MSERYGLLNRLKLAASAFSVSGYSGSRGMGFNYYADKPSWISLSTPQDFEAAVRFNPIVKANINLLATAASNGRKVAISTKTGEEIPWNENEYTKKAHQLLVKRPNPLQSAREFAYQGVFYQKTFGNRYVYALMPTGFDAKIDLMNIEVLNNLPSQFIDVRKTGKIYNQTDIKGIISSYARSNVNPPELYDPEHILHFNEVNISSQEPTIMGISKLEVLKMPISNSQLAFESMNTILRNRGQQGIISGASKDGMGSSMPMNDDERKEVENTFKNDYGLLNNQSPFIVSKFPLNYIKTIMSAKEIGIYEEFSNNAILISNEFGVPPELVKTYIQNATYENQGQSVQRLYQDTVMPQVADDDSYWSYRLDTYKYGFEIQTRWDHIPALAENKKDEATAMNMKITAASKAYNDGVITKNQYLIIIGQPTITDGDKYKADYEKGTIE